MPAGIIALLCFICFLVVGPLIFTDLMLIAFYKLDIPPFVGLSIVLSIIMGSFLNIPVKRYIVTDNMPIVPHFLFGRYYLFPEELSRKKEVIVAVNVGGCIVPLVLVAFQLSRLLYSIDSWLPLLAVLINIVLCYHISEFKAGVGIVMPAFLPGIVAALSGLLFYPENPSSVAFIAGVLGPLIGADLLHLEQLRKLCSGIVSIGGAGTFDGIVLSGFIALVLT